MRMPEQLPLMFVLLIMLLFAKVFGELFERMRIPSMAGEVFAGLLLGPALLGFVNDSDEIRAISDLGVFLLIVMAGMEIVPKEIRKMLRGKDIWIALIGFFLPMSAGILVGYLFGFDPLFNLFLGLCLAITALPISIRILMDLGKLNTGNGQRIILAAVFNDVLALLILGILLDFNGKTGLEPAFFISALKNLLKVLLFIAILFVVYQIFKLLRNRVSLVLPRMEKFLDFLRGKESLFALFMIVVLAFAGLAEIMGLHFIIGAFFGSILIPREILPEGGFDKVKKATTSISMGFLAPIFFAHIGLLINFGSLTNFLLFIVVIAAALFSKTAGGYIGGRLSGLNPRNSLVIGIGLNPRGIMELVIANIAYQKGFIDQAMFTILVFVALITTILAPFLLKWAFTFSGDRPDLRHGVPNKV